MGANEPTNSPIEVNVLVSNTLGFVANSVYSSSYTANVDPSFTAFSPLTNTIDVTQGVTFTNTVTGGSPPLVYAYTVNAASGFSIGVNNKITFTTAGTYTVSENVIDAQGFTPTPLTA